MNTTAKKRIGFLFGAGVSIPAGMPSTLSITEKVLSGDGIMRHSDECFYFGEPLFHHMGFPDECVPRIISFLDRIKSEIELYYLKYPYKVEFNYEDYYYLASQIFDAEIGEYDNPAILPLIEKIRPDLEHLLIGKENEVRKKWELYQLVDEAKNYIKDIIWRMLNISPTTLDYLGVLKDCYEDDDISSLYIFTLNHDVVLEKYFSANAIEYDSGFTRKTDNLMVWRPSFLDHARYKIRLLKLHGSVDWFRFRPEGSDWNEEIIGIPKGLTNYHMRDWVGRKIQALDRRPLFLVGTYNKILDYVGGIYDDLFYHFYKSTERYKRLSSLWL